jgi:hypothetical protein
MLIDKRCALVFLRMPIQKALGSIDCCITKMETFEERYVVQNIGR